MPTLAMLLAVLLWSSVVIAGKAAVTALPFSAVATARFLLGAALLWLIVLATRRAVRLEGAGPRLFMGLLDPGLVSLLVLWGLSLTSALNVAVFWSLMPVIMPLLARLFLGERVSLPVVGGALLALAGTALLVSRRSGLGEGSLLGDGIALCGILCACANQLLARRVAQKSGAPVVTTAWQISAAIVIGALGMALLTEPAQLPAPDPQIALVVLYLGTVGTAGPFLLYNYALRYLPVGRISLFPALSGPMAVPMAALLLGEPIAAWDIVAVAIVLAGAALPSAFAWTAARRRAPDPPLRELELVVIDTETTGMRPGLGDELVQLGAVVLRQERLAETFEELVDPERPIPASATAVHGVTNEMTAGRPKAAEGARRLAEFAAGRPIVAYDASFDLEFLRRHAAFDQPVLCLLRLARAVEQGRDCALDALAKRHGVSLEGRHTAPGDARIAAELLLRLLPAAEARGLGSLGRALAVAGARPRGF
jgi:drug/metabolite transporter (DMT)-like permease